MRRRRRTRRAPAAGVRHGGGRVVCRDLSATDTRCRRAAPAGALDRAEGISPSVCRTVCRFTARPSGLRGSVGGTVAVQLRRRARTIGRLLHAWSLVAAPQVDTLRFLRQLVRCLTVLASVTARETTIQLANRTQSQLLAKNLFCCMPRTQRRDYLLIGAPCGSGANK